MRRDNEGDGSGKAGADGRLVRRSGLLREPEQRQDSDAAPIEFPIGFVRHLIRENPSSDVLYLAMCGAAQEVGITKEQAERFMRAILSERTKSWWPEGFFA